jgi:hypothetical protein
VAGPVILKSAAKKFQINKLDAIYNTGCRNITMPRRGVPRLSLAAGASNHNGHP